MYVVMVFLAPALQCVLRVLRVLALGTGEYVIVSDTGGVRERDGLRYPAFAPFESGDASTSQKGAKRTTAIAI